LYIANCPDLTNDPLRQSPRTPTTRRVKRFSHTSTASAEAKPPKERTIHLNNPSISPSRFPLPLTSSSLVAGRPPPLRTHLPSVHSRRTHPHPPHQPQHRSLAPFSQAVSRRPRREVVWAFSVIQLFRSNISLPLLLPLLLLLFLLTLHISSLDLLARHSMFKTLMSLASGCRGFVQVCVVIGEDHIDREACRRWGAGVEGMGVSICGGFVGWE